MLFDILAHFDADAFLFARLLAHFANEGAVDHSHGGKDVHVIVITVTQGGVYLSGAGFAAMHRVRVFLLLESGEGGRV